MTKPKLNINKYVEIALGSGAVIVILGLASKGAGTYLTNMTNSQQDVISVTGVVVLAWLAYKLVNVIK